MQWTEVVERRSGDVVILDVQGDVTSGESPGRLFTAINRLVRQGDHKILLNLLHLPYIDSQGLADIIDGFNTTQRAGGALKLCHIAKGMRELLTVTKLATFIKAFDTEEEALNSFRSAGA
jgi:anti-anti-sigma factor